MNRQQFQRQIKTFEGIRQDWIDILVANPSRTDAPKHIVDINAKIEVLTTLMMFQPE